MSNNFSKRITGIFKKKRIQRDEAIVISKGGNSAFEESYNRLKDNILYCCGDEAHKVIQIESSIAGEGKTTLVSNLAVSLALNDKKVIVVDFDLRKSRIHRPFKVSKEIGIGEYASGEKTKEEIIKHTEYGVDVITRGKKIYNASLVLSSQKIKDLISELKEEYDFVLLDCPPVLIISDYINITRFSDAVIFVVAAGYTKKSAVKEAYNLLIRAGANVIGSVMTFAEESMHGYSYYKYGKYGKYGYHYGYRYYNSYGDKTDDEEKSADDESAGGKE